MHVMIFGAAGMIGRKLIRKLAQNCRLGLSEIDALTLVDVTQIEKPGGGRWSRVNCRCQTAQNWLMQFR
jgi:nucleoside-diphosphate-sugar epimerase